MNASDILKYGHGTVLQAIDGLAAAEWEISGVCGVWSVKNIIAHLASYELVLGEVLSSLQQHPDQPNASPGTQVTPMLNAFVEPGGRFNDTQVALRSYSHTEVLAEYISAYERGAALAAQLPAETFRQAGTLPWYGLEYALDDFIVYAFYGHKREHCAQIAVFRDQLAHR
jgi:hypothetical protein